MRKVAFSQLGVYTSRNCACEREHIRYISKCRIIFDAMISNGKPCYKPVMASQVQQTERLQGTVRNKLDAMYEVAK